MVRGSSRVFIVLTCPVIRIIHSLKGELSALERPLSEYPPVTLMGELIDLVEQEVVTRSSGRLLLQHILIHKPSEQTSVKELAKQLQLISFSNAPASSTSSEVESTADIHSICSRAIDALPSEIAAIRAGNRNVINKVVGWVIKETRGRADAKSVRKIVEELVDSEAKM